MDERVGILEAYIKAKHNQRIITVFCDMYDILDEHVVIKQSTITFKGYRYKGVYDVDSTLSLKEKLQSALKQAKAIAKQKKITRVIESLL
jgi:hypothetical protein